MKKNLRGKIREFVQSEEGKVGVKSPLTLGVATGSILLAHAVVGTHPARAVVGAWCEEDADCRPGWCDLIDCTEPDGAGQVTCWGVCRD